MTKVLFLAPLMAFAVAAAAQQYKWVDKDGKIRYGDTPPPGVKATALKPPPPPIGSPDSSAAADSPDAKDAAKGAKKGARARKGPLTPAEQEAEYRKRQLEAQKNREKEQQAAQEAQAKKENCSIAQEQLRALESGQRIARTDAQGERYYVDDAQRAQETARARQAVNQWCK